MCAHSAYSRPVSSLANLLQSVYVLHYVTAEKHTSKKEQLSLAHAIAWAISSCVPCTATSWSSKFRKASAPSLKLCTLFLKLRIHRIIRD